MLQIPLGNGLIAKIDDADADLVSGYSWWANVAGGRVYAYARVPGPRRSNKKIAMHRLVTDAPKGKVVHHINNDGLDNQRVNLSVGSQAENIAAHHHQFRSAVYLFKGRFRAQARVNSRRISLGMYDNEARAHAAVDAARRLLFTVSDIDLPGLVARVKYEARMGLL